VSLRTRIERLEDALETQQARVKPVDMTPFEKWRRLVHFIESARKTGENLEQAKRAVDGLGLGPVDFPEPDPRFPMDSHPELAKRVAKMLGLSYPPKAMDH
jgi:hypothetical protein